jgi:hypothetical protein
VLAGFAILQVLGGSTVIQTLTNSGGTILGTTEPAVAPVTVSVTATNVTGVLTAQLSSPVNAGGLPATAFFEYGLNTGYGASTLPVNFPPGFNSPTALLAQIRTVIPRFTYHFRAVASNSLGVVYGADLAFTAPSLYPPGDLNHDGVVDQSELNTVLSNYWPHSEWLYLTNTAGLGSTNVTFALTNASGRDFSVLKSTNLVDWDYLGPATPLYQFFDTNAPALPQRYYRLRWP